MNIIKDYIEPGLSLLPPKMDTDKARAMLVATSLQESGFTNRKQIGGGPARGFWQNEKTGAIKGVLTHPSTKELIREVCARIVVPADIDLCYGLIAYHDALACCFARLLLWTLPRPLPGPDEPDEGWRQYLEAWRPGKPRPADWPGNYSRAWMMVKG